SSRLHRALHSFPTRRSSDLVKAFGGHVTVTLDDGRVIEDEIAVADAHPLGARPWRRPDYVGKFRTLAEGVVSEAEQNRFLAAVRSEEHTSELQSRENLVCRL